MPSPPERRRARLALAPVVERAEGRLLMTALGVDNRLPVGNTMAYPYNAIVHLDVVFPDGKSYTGSGAMIDATHVLTVAHNIYSRRDGGWATVVGVFPGQTGETIPLGSYRAVRETIYTEYAAHEHRNGHDFRHDLAVLRLNVPVVPGVGALGQEVQGDAFFHNATLTTTGYPGDLPAGSPVQGTVMYTTVGHTTHADSHLVYYTMPTAGGQSGSPVYRETPIGTYIDGLVSYGSPADVTVTYNNGAVRITPVVYSDVKSWSAVDVIPNPQVVFRGAELPGDPTTFRVTTPYTPQGLMHVLPG